MEAFEFSSSRVSWDLNRFDGKHQVKDADVYWKSNAITLDKYEWKLITLLHTFILFTLWVFFISKQCISWAHKVIS